MKKIGVIVWMIAIGSMISCSSSKQKGGESEDNSPEVKVAEAKMEIVNIETEFSGNIEPFVKNNISSAIPQRIEKIFVEIGSRVRKGDVLVRMEGISYTQATTQFKNSEIDFQRLEALYNAGGISKQQYDQAKTQLYVAKENLRNLEQNTKLISPIDGVVTNKFFDSGDISTGQPILTVMQLQPVKIMINISEEFFPKTKIGTPVDVVLDIYEGRRFAGNISVIYPTIDPSTRTFCAEVKIDNPKMELRPGMFARAKVNFGTAERVLIPDVAVIKQVGTNDKYVYRIDRDTAKYERIITGGLIGDKFVIIDGVNDGDKVVIAGQNRLIDRVKVRVLGKDTVNTK